MRDGGGNGTLAKDVVVSGVRVSRKGQGGRHLTADARFMLSALSCQAKRVGSGWRRVPHAFWTDRNIETQGHVHKATHARARCAAAGLLPAARCLVELCKQNWRS